MPSLVDHPAPTCLKLIMVGESGTGKTGALAALAKAGYNLRILDLDNLLGILADLLRNDKAALARVKYITLTEPMKTINGKAVPKQATVWKRTLELLESWKDGDEKLGSVREWTPKEVLVIDTLSRLCDSAFYHLSALNGTLLTGPQGFAYQRVLGQAQGLVNELMQLLNDDCIKCNVIMNAHLAFQDEPGTQRASIEDVLPQVGVVQTMGKKLSPKVPSYFGAVLQTKRVNGKPRIITTPQAQSINLKAYAPSKVKAEYPIETGLADYFFDVMGTKP